MSKKKVVCSFLAVVLSISAVCRAFALSPADAAPSDGVDVRVNGYLVEFPDKKPYVNSDSRTLIPVRFVAEALGAKVSWNGQRNAAQIETDNLMILLPADTNKMEVTRNGKTTTKILDTTTIVEEGRTMIPIRAVAEEMGCWASFSGAYNTVEIYNDGLTAEEMTAIYELPLIDSTWWQIGGVSDYVGAAMNVGRYKLENLSEHAIRTVKDSWKITPEKHTGASGMTFDFVNDSAEDMMQYLVKEAEADFEIRFSSEDWGVSADYRSNASCVFSHPANVIGNRNYHNIGVLTITFDNDADIAKYAARKFAGSFDFAKCKPGESYTFLIDSMWTFYGNGQWRTQKMQNISTDVNSGDWW